MGIFQKYPHIFANHKISKWRHYHTLTCAITRKNPQISPSHKFAHHNYNPHKYPTEGRLEECQLDENGNMKYQTFLRHQQLLTKMGVAQPHPMWWSGKNSRNSLDHRIIYAKRTTQKRSTIFQRKLKNKKWAWPCHTLLGGWPRLAKCLKIFWRWLSDIRD